MREFAGEPGGAFTSRDATMRQLGLLPSVIRSPGVFPAGLIRVARRFSCGTLAYPKESWRRSEW